MAQSVYTNFNVYGLEEAAFIAGSYKELYFDVYNTNGSPINITTASIVWNLCPYGDPSYIALSVAGSPVVSGSVNYQFVVVLSSDDTENLGGKYIQQPVIESIPGEKYIPSQGIITIMPKIGA